MTMRGHAAMPAGIARLFLAVLLLCSLGAVPAMAQEPEQTAAAAKTLDQGRQDLDAIDQAFDGRLTSKQRQDLRDRAASTQSDANDAVAALQAQMQQVQARIAELGPAPVGVTEAPDIQAQRKLLTQQQSTIDSETKRGRLLAVDASQLGDEIAASETEQFNQRMSERTASPATPAFWDPVAHAFPRDSRRTFHFFSDGVRAFVGGLTSGRGWIGVAGLLIAFALLVPVRGWLRRIGRHYVIEQAPESRVRRSAYALWLSLTGTLGPGLAAAILIACLRWAGMISPGWNQLAGPLVHYAFVGGAIGAIGGALLQRRAPQWRMVPVSDEAAGVLRWWTWIAAAVTVVSLSFMRLNDAMGISGPASAAGDAAVALAYLLLITGILLTIGRLRAESIRALEKGETPVQRTGVTLGSLVAWLGVLAALVALLLGFLTLSRFIAFMIVWITLIGGALHLLLDAANTIVTSIFSRHSRIGRSAHYALGIRQSAVDQFGVLLSAFLRVVLVIVALGMVLMPFGTDVGSLFDTIWSLAQGITIGQVTISPGAILRAAAVLAFAMFVVGLIQRWLTGSYLPTTELDASARNSVSMVARYTGIVLACLWAAASLGIGLERIALLLSALSVGIGFGLQAITQNFVSGLILLAERPVKIGDWVRIGDQEGDVKRISVRATEIQVADRSTLIVPNSELITKTIQNMTLASPIGRIQLQFSVLLGTDPARVRDIVLGIFEATPNVLSKPETKVFIDRIADGRIFFNCFAYVPSPRDTYSARSAILFEMLGQFVDAGIDIGTGSQTFQLVGTLPDIATHPQEGQ